MSDKKTIRVFISSPSDVRPERLKAEQIVARLDRQFAYYFHVEPVLWEREPLVASQHFQDERNLLPPRQTDIVVVILWKRLGVWLPMDRFSGAVSHRRPVTGTEWEFEDALAGARQHDVPDLLFYRKTEQLAIDLDDEQAYKERKEQRDLAEDFMTRWFRSADNKSFTAAQHSFRTTAEFEDQLFERLRTLLERRSGSKSGEVKIRWHQAPFRGLESFEFEHAPVFFGRTRARNEIRELLAKQAARRCGFVLVLGASGCGKSSLVKAGLLPDLALPGMIGRVALVRWGIMRPSRVSGDPIAALVTAMIAALPELDALRYTPERLSALLRKAPEQAVVPVEQGLIAAGKQAGLTEMGEARLVIVVDQLEEIFSMEGPEPVVRDAFIAALDALAHSGPIWLVATMRSDFFDRTVTLPVLARLADEDACYHLLPPDDAELGQIIRQPAREAGLRFGYDAQLGKSLDEVIHQAACKDRGVLPLLSFLLDQLWKQHTDLGELTFAAYHALGGLEGALGRRAEEIFTAQPADVQAALPQVLRALVTVGQGKHAIAAARPAPRERFSEQSPEGKLIAAFTTPKARLLIADGDHLRIAHEALLTHWERARQWIFESRADLELEERLDADAGRWADAAPGDKPSLLRPTGLPLNEAEDLLARIPNELGATTIEFIRASTAAEKTRRIERERKLRRAWIIACCVLIAFAVAVSAGIASSMWNIRNFQMSEAFASRTVADAAIRSGQYERAMRFAVYGLPPPHLPEALQHLLAPIGLQKLTLSLVGPVTLGWDDTEMRRLEAKAAGAAEASLQRLKLTGHQGPVRTAAFSADGKFIITSSDDGSARVWDASSGAMILRLDDGGALRAASFSRDGARIITASADGWVKIWNAKDGRLIRQFKVPGGTLWSAAFSPNGLRIVTASADSVGRIWNAEQDSTPVLLHAEEGKRMLDAEFSPNGTLIVTASDDHTARMWDAETGLMQLQLVGHHTNGVRSAAFSPDGKFIVTASFDNTAQVWTAQGQWLRALKHSNWVMHAAFSPDGQSIVTACYDGSARVWNAQTGEQLFQLSDHTGSVVDAAFSPDGTRIVTASADKTARVWDATGWPEILHINRIATADREDGESDEILDANFSPDGTRVAIASTDHTARIWDTASGRPVGVPLRHDGIVRSAAFSPDGMRIVTASDDTTARLWDAANDEQLLKLKDTTAVKSAAFSSDGKLIVTASGSGAHIWDAASGAPLLSFGQGQTTVDAEFSPDGRRILTASTDGAARIWDSKTGVQLGTPLKHEGVVWRASFSPDGSRIVTASWDHTARIWDAMTGKELVRFEGHSGMVYGAAFSPDGERVATGSWDRTVSVWDAATGEELLRLKGDNGPVRSIVFNRDGTRILTASEDGTVRLWNANWLAKVYGEPLAHRVCAEMLAGDARTFTPADAFADPLLSGVAGQDACKSH